MRHSNALKLLYDKLLVVLVLFPYTQRWLLYRLGTIYRLRSLAASLKCTEVLLLVQSLDTARRLFDTESHVKAWKSDQDWSSVYNRAKCFGWGSCEWHWTRQTPTCSCQYLWRRRGASSTKPNHLFSMSKILPIHPVRCRTDRNLESAKRSWKSFLVMMMITKHIQCEMTWVLRLPSLLSPQCRTYHLLCMCVEHMCMCTHDARICV